MSTLKKRNPATKLLAAAAVASSMLAFNAVPAQAGPILNEIQHTFDCLNLLIENPTLHAEKCGTGDGPTVKPFTDSAKHRYKHVCWREA